MELNYKKAGVWDRYPVPMHTGILDSRLILESRTWISDENPPSDEAPNQEAPKKSDCIGSKFSGFSLGSQRNSSPKKQFLRVFFVSPSGTTCGVLDTSLGVSCFLLVDFVIDLKVMLVDQLQLEYFGVMVSIFIYKSIHLSTSRSCCSIANAACILSIVSPLKPMSMRGKES